MKTFGISAEGIRPMAEGRGSCFASDMITTGGHRIEDPANIGLHDVNTIANYDPAIIPFLDAPVGAAFERPSADKPLQPAADWAAPEED
jgi:hypothetical protein